MACCELAYGETWQEGRQEAGGTKCRRLRAWTGFCKQHGARQHFGNEVQISEDLRPVQLWPVGVVIPTGPHGPPCLWVGVGHHERKPVMGCVLRGRRCASLPAPVPGLGLAWAPLP